MEKRPRRLAVPRDEDDPDGLPPRRRSGLALPIAVLVGLAAGAVAIGLLVSAARNSDDGAAALAVESTPAETIAVAVEPLKIVFPEGFTWREMTERVDAVRQIAIDERQVTPTLSGEEFTELAKNEALIPQEFLAAGEKPKHLEGFLFPATYDFLEETTTTELVRQQLEQFELAWNQLNLAFPTQRGLSPYEVLIIASMVEEEVAEPQERKKVARVIYNRLQREMPLGIDSTLRYGLRIPPDRAIKQSQLESDNPYNTRLLVGLPPTPISNPGLASMQAAARPGNNEFLYYARTKDCKTHFFGKTKAEFDAFLAGPNSFLNGPDNCG